MNSNRFSGQKIFDGAGYVGYYAKKGSKRPVSRSIVGITLRGAAETALILGGGTILLNKANISSQNRNGAQFALALLSAKQIVLPRIQQIRSVNQYSRQKRL